MIRLFSESFAILVAAAAATGITFWIHPNAPPLYTHLEPLRDDEVTLEIIDQRWGGKVQWVDARITEHFEKGHIPGAESINEQAYSDQLFDLMEKLQDLDRPIVVYCGTERCQASRKIADKLKTNLPILEIYVLRGGWPAWKNANPNETERR